MSLVGRKTADSFQNYNADKVFLSCKGLDMQKGITDGNDETGSMKQTMIQAARKVYLVADHLKFGNVAFAKICDLSEIDVIITDQKPENHWLDYLDRMGISCLYPED